MKSGIVFDIIYQMGEHGVGIVSLTADNVHLIQNIDFLNEKKDLVYISLCNIRHNKF